MRAELVASWYCYCREVPSPGPDDADAVRYPAAPPTRPPPAGKGTP